MRLIDLPSSIIQGFIIFFIFLFVASIIGLFVTLILARKKYLIVLSSLTFLLSFVLVFLTMRGSYCYRFSRPVFEPSLRVLSWPLWVFILVSLLLLISIVYELIFSYLWNKRHITILSIKESMDSLPSGICFFDENGTVRLINHVMNDVSGEVTGSSLRNGVAFCKDILKIDIDEISMVEESPKILLMGDKAFSFLLLKHRIEGENVYELEVFDVSELYRLTKELENKSLELKNRNKRLLQYGENIKELTSEKEVLAAKIHIHDELGKLLLITKKKLQENLTKGEQGELLSLWKNELGAFTTFSDKVEKKEELLVLKEVATLIGIDLHFEGEKPLPNTYEEKIFKVAIHECLTNASKHANAKNLYVKGERQKDKYEITIANDGKKPNNDIVLGGGLSSLKLLVEKANGEMEVVSKPEFTLRISLKRGDLA